MSTSVTPSPVLPALSPCDDHELRVHGVAGSTPESMLGLIAVQTAPCVPSGGRSTRVAPGEVSVWKPPKVEQSLRVYSWSSLTSGHWYQALYLVLLPFMLANLAGWMIVGDVTPSRRGGRLRWAIFLVRAVGLVVTGVFVVSAQIIVADVAAIPWLHHPAAVPAVTGAVLIVTVALTRIRQRRGGTPTDSPPPPWTNHQDPAGRCTLAAEQHLMWNSPGINVTLRWLHLDAGLGTIALLAVAPGTDALATVAWWLGVATVAIAAGLLMWTSLGNGTTGMGPTMLIVRPLSAVAGLALTLATVDRFQVPQAATDPQATALGAIAWLALAVGVGVFILAVFGLVTRWHRAALNAPMLLLLAASIGAMLGAGIAGQVGRWNPDCAAMCPAPGGYVAWLAGGVTVSLAVLVGYLAIEILLLCTRGSSFTVAPRLVSAAAGRAPAVMLGTGLLLLALGLWSHAFGGDTPVGGPARQRVGDEAVMSQLQHLLDAGLFSGDLPCGGASFLAFAQLRS